MSLAAGKDADQLQTLERWRTSELERAQAQHARQQAVVQQDEKAVAQAEQLLTETQTQMRSLGADSRPFSADELVRLRMYAEIRQQGLEQAMQALATSRRLAEDARAVVARKFEALSVVERLRARRKTGAQRAFLRAEEKRLDDQALQRGARSTSNPTADEKD